MFRALGMWSTAHGFNSDHETAERCVKNRKATADYGRDSVCRPFSAS